MDHWRSLTGMCQYLHSNTILNLKAMKIYRIRKPIVSVYIVYHIVFSNFKWLYKKHLSRFSKYLNIQSIAFARLEYYNINNMITIVFFKLYEVFNTIHFNCFM